MAYIEKELLLNSITKDEIKKILRLLGIEEYREGKRKEIILRTWFCHKGGSWKLYYYHEPTGRYPGKTFHCYTCGDSYNLIEFVLRLKRNAGDNPTYYQVLQFIASAVSDGNTSRFNVGMEEKIDDWKWINRLNSIKKVEKNIPILDSLNEHLLELFSYKPHKEFLNDNIAENTLQMYEIGYWGKTNQIILPHRGFNGQLWGVRGRNLSTEEVSSIGKYQPLFIENKFLSHNLGENLYGIHLNQDKIKNCHKVMLVEGEKGVMQNHTYFGENNFALATCGNHISSTQIRILLQYLRVNEVILAFDRMYEAPDSYEATIYYNRLVLKAANLIPYCRVTLLLDRGERIPYKASPTDISKEVLLEMLENKILITTQELSRVFNESRKKTQ